MMNLQNEKHKTRRQRRRIQLDTTKQLLALLLFLSLAIVLWLSVHVEQQERIQPADSTTTAIKSLFGHRGATQDETENKKDQPMRAVTMKSTAAGVETNTERLLTSFKTTTTTAQQHDRKPWHDSTMLPDWAKEYMDWYTNERQNLSEENWKQSHRFLILQCLMEDDHCGGTSDRLKPLPLMLWLAHKSKRLFMIRWTRPCKLEEFLVPNYYNWTVPEWLAIHLSNKRENGHMRTQLEKLTRDVIKPDISIIRTRIQVFDGGSQYFEQQTGISYQDMYHDLFRVFFEPSAKIARILQSEMNMLQITPNNYATAHYRAFYGKRAPDTKRIEEFAVNAVNCASQLRPGGPIYFASDSKHAIQTIQQYAKSYKRRIVTIENQEPLHLDKDAVDNLQPSSFYSIFVDLYLLGNGRCGSYGQGGFGRYGLLMSYNASCVIRHTSSNNRRINKCEWKDNGNVEYLKMATA